VGTTLGWGIVGTAGIADREMAPAIGKSSGSELVGVVSRDETRAREFAERHGAPRALTSYEELLADPAVDIVYIATPNALHADQTAAAARAGKHILGDKPLATGVADARRAADAADAAGVKLGVNFQTRHHEVMPEIRKRIADGEIGDALSSSASSARDASPSRGGGRIPSWRASGPRTTSPSTPTTCFATCSTTRSSRSRRSTTSAGARSRRRWRWRCFGSRAARSRT
jgi:predicted dehydrogenase